MPTSSAPKVFMRAAARTLPTPQSRSMSGMARSHRGFAGTVQVLSARWPPGRLAAAWTGFARATSAGTVDPSRDAPVAPSGRLCGPLDGGAGGGSSGPAGGPRVDTGGGRGRGDLDGHDASGAARGARGTQQARRRRTGRSPDPPGAAAAEAGAPRSRPSRGAALESAPNDEPAAQRTTSCVLSPRLATDGPDGLGIGNDQLCDRGRHSRERS